MALPIACQSCGASFGSVNIPSRDDLRALLAQVYMSALASRLPENVGEAVVAVLRFDCAACIVRRHGDAAQLLLAPLR